MSLSAYEYGFIDCMKRTRVFKTHERVIFFGLSCFEIGFSWSPSADILYSNSGIARRHYITTVTVDMLPFERGQVNKRIRHFRQP